MVTLANINIWGRKAATVLWNDNTQSAVFEYDSDFTLSGLELSPLQMPLQRRHAYTFASLSHDTFMGLPGLLADALPDAYGKALLDRWLASVGRTFANPVERLCYQGKRSMGALEFEPAQDSFLEQGNSIEIDSLVQVAREALDGKRQLNVNLNADRKEALLNIIKVGTSAGGQRAKAVIAYNQETGEVRSGQMKAPEGFTQWLLKLDGVTNQELGDPKQGIEMMPSRLVEENGRAHFMTRRFDRTDNNQKLHMQTLCGLAHFDYKLLRAYSYEQAFQVMRQLHLPYSQAQEMFRRMVFNVVSRNQDDHTKNISFLMTPDGKWQLSPAYDVTWAYNPTGEWTSQHQMSINGKWTDITRSDLMTVASSMHINRPDEIIEQVQDSVAAWPEAARKAEIPDDTMRAIQQTHSFV